MPLRFEAAILSRIRSPVTSRSNWANDSRTLSVNRPIDVFVLNCSVTATNETHGRRIFQPSWRSQTRIGETINLVHHDDVDQLLADVLKQALQGRAFHRPAGKAPIVVMNLDELPPTCASDFVRDLRERFKVPSLEHEAGHQATFGDRGGTCQRTPNSEVADEAFSSNGNRVGPRVARHQASGHGAQRWVQAAKSFLMKTISKRLNDE